MLTRARACLWIKKQDARAIAGVSVTTSFHTFIAIQPTDWVARS